MRIYVARLKICLQIASLKTEKAVCFILRTKVNALANTQALSQYLLAQVGKRTRCNMRFCTLCKIVPFQTQCVLVTDV